MTLGFTWKTAIGTVNGHSATQVSQIDKNGKVVKTDTYIDFNNDGINDLKVFKQGGKTSVFTAAARNDKSSWDEAPIEYDIYKESTFEQTTQKPTSDTKTSTPIETPTKKQEEGKPQTQQTVHTVAKGETLGIIAKKYGCTVKALAEENDIKNIDKISRGQVLKIPAKKAAENTNTQTTTSAQAPQKTQSGEKTAPATQEKTDKEPEFIEHTLAKGENIDTLAKRYGVNASHIKKINGITKENERKLQIGQKIKIPKFELTYTEADKQNIEILKTSIMSEEGLKLTAYKCPAGKWTIGYGHTANVKSGDTITQEKAIEYLEADLKKAYDDLQKLLFEEGITDLDDGKKRALVDLIFNVGVGKLKGSNLIKYIKEGNFEKAQAELNYFSAGGKPQGGLIKRRIAGMKEFLNGRLTEDAKKEIITAINDYLGANVETWDDAIALLNEKGKHDIAKLMQEPTKVASNN